ncbi:uncharacterized protein LOC139918990 [Centroberyx gerrardi]
MTLLALNTTSSPLIAPPSNFTTSQYNFTTSQSNFTTCQYNFTTCQSNFTTCQSNFTTCQYNFTTCQSNFTTCQYNFTTSQSNFTTCQSNFTTCQSNFTTCQYNFTSSQCNFTTCQYNFTTSQSNFTTCQCNFTTSQCNFTTCQCNFPTISTTSPPVNATSPPVNATSPPVNATSPPVSTTSPPVNATSPPVNATSPPVNATSPPVSTTSPPVNATSPPVSATFAPIQETVFNLKFNLERVFTETLAHRTSADYLVLSNEVVSVMNNIGNAAFGRNYSRSRINGYSPGSGSVVVDADLIFNDVSSISASDVTAAVKLAASFDFPLPLNTSSVVVTRVTSTQVPSPVTTPDFTSATLDLTTFAHAEVKLSSSKQLMEDDMTVYIEEFLRQIGAYALGPLKVAVKRVARCNGTQCGDEDTAHPPTFTPSTPSTPSTSSLYTSETDESSGLGPL